MTWQRSALDHDCKSHFAVVYINIVLVANMFILKHLTADDGSCITMYLIYSPQGSCISFNKWNNQYMKEKLFYIKSDEKFTSAGISYIILFGM